MNPWRVVIDRCVHAIPLVLLVLLTTFLLINLAPGDPAALLAGVEAPPDVVAGLRAELGLDRPLHERFVTYAGELLRGNLGQSTVYRGQGVTGLILGKLPATLVLMGAGYVFALVLGIALGTLGAARRGSGLDYGLTSLSLVFYSQPEFWTGIVFVLVFSVWLGWFPVSGFASPGLQGLDYAVDVLWHLALPALVLGLTRAALYSRIVRSSLVSVLAQDYVTTHRAYGFSESTVLNVYALRNAVLPLLTVMGLELRYMFAGAVVLEVVFSWPGIGRLLFDAIFGRDYALMLGLFFITSLVTVGINLLTDLAYYWLDPRIRA